MKTKRATTATKQARKRALPKRVRKPTAGKKRGPRPGGGIAVYADDIRRLRLATPPATLKQIADWIATTYGEKPVSRERVRQVLVEVTSVAERAAVWVAQQAPTSCRICGKEGRTLKGLCPTHRARQRRGEDLNAPIRQVSHEPSKCVDCPKMIGPGTGKQRNRGRCPGCYGKWAYYNLPGRQEAVHKSAAKWLNKALKNKKYAKHFQEMQRAAQRRYNAKRALARRQAERKKALALKTTKTKKALADKRAGTKRALP